jgi:hypothetical protein
MATLPDVPQNTILALGVLAGAGLVAFTTHTRAKIDSQVHENYRHAKLVDAGMQPETTKLKIAKDG